MEAGAPDLVVEVISKSSQRLDRVKKLGWCAQIGVPEYWIVDSLNDTFERLTLGPDGHFIVAEALKGPALFRPPSFGGLEIPLSELWNVPKD